MKKCLKCGTKLNPKTNRCPKCRKKKLQGKRNLESSVMDELFDNSIVNKNEYIDKILSDNHTGKHDFNYAYDSSEIDKLYKNKDENRSTYYGSNNKINGGAARKSSSSKKSTFKSYYGDSDLDELIGIFREDTPKSEGKNKRNFTDNTYHGEVYSKNDSYLPRKSISMADETTFNGAFSKKDEIEETFFKKKSKNRKNRFGDENRKKRKIVESAAGVIGGIAGNAFSRKTKSRVKPTSIGYNKGEGKRDKVSKKLVFSVFGLGVLAIVLVILAFNLVGGIASRGDSITQYPKSTDILSFFDNISSMTKEEFLAAPKGINFSSYLGTTDEKNKKLGEFYDYVKSPGFAIKGITSMDGKGPNRVQINFDIAGSDKVKSIFKNLIFKKNDSGVYELDFLDFVTKSNSSDLGINNT